MAKEIIFLTVEDRNNKIVELYNKGIKYSYTDKRKDNTYLITYEEE